MRYEFTFPKNYQIRVLAAPPPVHPVEMFYHYPVELEEGDRSGVYVRVSPSNGPAWFGFFALGFDSPNVTNAICSCPDPDSVCVVAGGYAYVVKVKNPQRWFRVEQKPVVEVKTLSQQHLILFQGFTSITAVGQGGIAWTTERLSWEGIRVAKVSGDRLYGFGWDAVKDAEVPFEVDVRTGKHTGGTRPEAASP